MTKEISIVIISHNRYPQNQLSLYSLENQTFDKSKMEVIFVDDCSTDDTWQLELNNYSFDFKYVRLDQVNGRSKSRNYGLNLTKGNIMILLDAEIIIDPKFVEKHYNWHLTNDENVIVHNNSYHGVFTVFDKGFSHDQLAHINYILSKQSPKNRKKYKRALRRNIFPNSNQIPLIDRDDVYNLEYRNLSFNYPIFNDIATNFNSDLTGFLLPWRIFLSGASSFKRSLLEKAGYFDELFEGYGVEDTEFGYRLVKAGGRIIDDNSVGIYHQEHPKNWSILEKEIHNNFYKFFMKHPEFDVGSVCLEGLGKSWYEINELNKEQKKLESTDTVGEYEILIHAYKLIFKSIITLKKEEKELENVLNIVNESDFEDLRNNILFAINKLEVEMYEEYKVFINTLKWLINL